MRNLKYLASIFGCLALALVLPRAFAQQTATVPIQVISYADMVVYNGKVMTMDDSSTNQTPGRMGQAMAIRDGKLLAVGSDAEDEVGRPEQSVDRMSVGALDRVGQREE